MRCSWLFQGCLKNWDKDDYWTGVIKSKDWRYASSKIDQSMLHACFKYASEQLESVAASKS